MNPFLWAWPGEGPPQPAPPPADPFSMFPKAPEGPSTHDPAQVRESIDRLTRGGTGTPSFGVRPDSPSHAERLDAARQGKSFGNLDTNWARPGQSTNPMVVIPDGAPPEQRRAAADYAERIAKLQRERLGLDVSPQVKTRSENGRGRPNTFHTEPYSVNDPRAAAFFNTEEGRRAHAQILRETLGTVPGLTFSQPHDPGRGDYGAHGPYGSEVDLARPLLQKLGGPTTPDVSTKDILAQAQGPTVPPRLQEQPQLARAPQITAQSASPTSPKPAAPARSAGMIDGLLNALGFGGQQSAQPPASASNMISSLEKMLGIKPDDPMYGSFVALAEALANTRRPEEWGPGRRAMSGFADAMGTGLMARAGVNVPMHMAETLKGQSAERQKLEDRAYQAQLQFLGQTIPYVQERAKQRALERAMNGQPLTERAPIAPGGAGGVQMPGPAASPAIGAARPPGPPQAPPAPLRADPQATAPVTPVQRQELPDPTAGAMNPPSAPQAAGPAQPSAMPMQPPMPQLQQPPPQPGVPATPMPAPSPAATPDQPPTGPNSPGSKYRTTLEAIEQRFPLIPQNVITAVAAIDPARARILQAQNDDTLKQRDQMIKIAEAHRDQGIAANLTPAQKAVDGEFAKDYAAFATGGYADAQKGLAQLRDVMSTLRDPNSPSLTGPITGSLPDWYQSFNNPLAVSTREKVEEVVQRNLRVVLGAQFTEKEGERLIARAYNPRLSEEENAARVGRLLNSIENSLKAKVEAARYFEQHGTLAGYRGAHRISLDEIERNAGLSESGRKGEQKAGGSGSAQSSRSAAQEPMGATRVINGQTYVKVQGGWMPQGGAPSASPSTMGGAAIDPYTIPMGAP